MTTTVQKTVEVNAPVSTVYNQWTQFEDFPQFMGGVQQVTQLDEKTLHWVAEIAGVKREWDAAILEQVPDEKIAWAATEGATNAGAVFFQPLGSEQTAVTLSLEYEPEGLIEKAGDLLNIVERQAQADVESFKAFIESEGFATGAWRGAINEGAGLGAPGVEAAASSQGDKGKAGLSGKAVVAGAAAAAVGIAAVKNSGSSDTEAEVDVEFTPDVPVAEVAPLPGDEVEAAEVVEVDVVNLDADEDIAIVDREVVAPGSTDEPLR